MKVRRWMVLGTLLAPPMHPTSSCDMEVEDMLGDK
eukprot:CAMPEP_0179481666 /NCGR_PEP_ID=MMETSP0799-20121207/59339_1 /TAXON_ID=46947 /ORGANISM="Geminigera cryophila, Strain CCMP2564" /LENGTH=34 /DNA_ID= /DNA_START= /DNA_END= /DNA_ORIENTATION=